MTAVRPSRRWMPAPAYPNAPVSVVGQRVAAVLASLRERCEGREPQQVRTPRKARKRRDGEISLTEFAAQVGLGPRQVRTALLSAGILQTEIEVRDRGRVAPEYQHTVRLTPEAVKGGLGRRLEPRSGQAYDVLTPKGQKWAAEQLRQREQGKPKCRRKVREDVRRLLLQGETQAEIARTMGLSKQRVHYLAKSMVAVN